MKLRRAGTPFVVPIHAARVQRSPSVGGQLLRRILPVFPSHEQRQNGIVTGAAEEILMSKYVSIVGSVDGYFVTYEMVDARRGDE